MLTFTNAFISGMMEDLIDMTPPSGILTGCYLMLYTNNIAVTPDLEIEDLTEASYSGYARQAITWDATPKHSSETDCPIIVADDVLNFERTAGGLDQVVRGYAIVSAIGGTAKLYATRQLDAPETMEVGGLLSIVPRVGWNPEANVPGGDVTAT